MHPSALLQAVRRRRGLTQADLARRAGTSQPVISAYERGHRDPTVGTLERLIRAAGEQLALDAVASTSDLPPATTPEEHGERLAQVLSLADAIPVRPRPALLLAPRMTSR